MKKNTVINHLFLMNVNHNKMHGFHDIVNQIESLHHFVHRIVRGLSAANHHGALTQGTIPGLILELVNDKGNPLVHESIQVRLGTRHFHHHANLKKKTFQCPGHEKKIR